jgi:hypothetical protein
LNLLRQFVFCLVFRSEQLDKPSTIMTKNISKIAVLSLFTAAALVAMPALSRAEGTSTNAPASSGQTPAKPKPHGNLPFHGNLSAVDTKALTLTVGTLTLQVTSDTLITKNGKSATLADGVVGEQVSGAYKKTDGGKLNATSVHFGGKSERKNTEPSGTNASH